MTTVLVASDKFKGSLTAAEVAAAVGDGVRSVVPDARIMAVPVADGGDGTVAAAVAAGFIETEVVVTGPTGEPVSASYARRGDVAVVELATASGLARLPGGVRVPLRATSHGTGELVAAAIEAGCREIVLGVGGSASTDGGAGLVRALGARLLDEHGRELGATGGGGLPEVATLDLTGLRTTLAGVSVTVASDVDNPLIGPRGAAAVYGPQKGADAELVGWLDAALAHWADVVATTTGYDLRGHPGSGAAGGVGFAALALLDADLRPGIDLVLELVRFSDMLPEADLVVTGEGALDEQTLHGKAPAGVADAAGRAGVPVVAVCGRNALSARRSAAAGIGAVYALTELEPDPAVCVRDGARLLRRLGARVAAEHLTTPKHGTER